MARYSTRRFHSHSTDRAAKLRLCLASGDARLRRVADARVSLALFSFTVMKATDRSRSGGCDSH